MKFKYNYLSNIKEKMLTNQMYSKLFKIQTILVKQNNDLNHVLNQLNKEIQREAMCKGFKNQKHKIDLLSIENKRLRKIIENYQK